MLGLASKSCVHTLSVAKSPACISEPVVARQGGCWRALGAVFLRPGAARHASCCVMCCSCLVSSRRSDFAAKSFSGCGPRGPCNALNKLHTNFFPSLHVVTLTGLLYACCCAGQMVVRTVKIGQDTKSLHQKAPLEGASEWHSLVTSA